MPVGFLSPGMSVSRIIFTTFSMLLFVNVYCVVRLMLNLGVNLLNVKLML